MRVFRSTYRTRDGKTKKTAKWYIEIRDHIRVVRRFTGFTDRKQTESLGRQIERLANCRAAGDGLDADLSRWLEHVPQQLRDRFVEIGLLDSTRAAAGKSLLQHIKDWQQALLDKGDTAQQARQVASRVRRIVKGCKFQVWSDIQASRVQRFIAQLREGGLSCRTANFYLQAIRQFASWMVSDRRAGESPVAHLRGFKAQEIRDDQRHPRRALEVDEARRLLAATQAAPKRYCMTGQERSMCYRVAIESGLRAGEVRSLTVASFDLDGCTVTVQGRYSKRRREDTLPLRSETAEDLRAFFTGKLPEARAFRMPSKSRVANMVKADLTAAGIEYIDAAGRYADFHSLRHTTGSFLAAAGVHPKVAQQILRHSRIELTMGIYTHTLRGQESQAIGKLPDLSIGPESQQAKATGTDNVTPNSLAPCLARPSGKQRILVDDNGQTEVCIGSETVAQKAHPGLKNADSGAEMKEAAVGFEPTNNGFANRRLRPLGYAAFKRGAIYTPLLPDSARRKCSNDA